MRNIYKLFAFNFFLNLFFAQSVLTFFYFEKGLNLTHMLVLEAVVFGTAMLLEIPTGVLADKYGRKWSLLAAELVFLLFWIIFLFANTFVVFVCAFAIAGLGVALNSGAMEALFYDALKAQGKEKLMQKWFGGFQAMAVFGTGIAGLVGVMIAKDLTLPQFYTTLYLAVGAQAIGTLILLTVKEPKRSRSSKEIADRPESTLTKFKAGFENIRSNPHLTRIVKLFVFTSPFSIVLFYLYQPYFQLAEVPTEWLGIALFISGVLVGLFKLFSYRIEQWFGVQKGMIIVTVVPGLLWIAMAFVFHPVFAVVLFILSDGFGNVRDPIFTDYHNRAIPSETRATTLSSISLLQNLYFLLAWPIIGLLADQSLSLAFLSMGCMIVLASVAFRINANHVRKR